MVASKLNSSVNYVETMKVENQDKKTEKEMYQLEIFGVNCIITIGEPINKFLENNIIYVPIYLLKKNRKVLQIGVYEFDKKKISFNILDDELLYKFISESSPLLYSFVDRDFILKRYLSPEDYEHQEKEKDLMLQNQENNDVININIEDIFTINKKINTSILPTETKQDALLYRKNFKSARNNISHWIQKFMSNTFYDELDNEGGGDCFFATVRDAYKSIGMNTTVANLRQLLSDRISEKQFTIYKKLYEDNLEQITNMKNEYNIKKKELEELKQKIATNISRTEKQDIVTRSKVLKTEMVDLREGIILYNNYFENYKFMKHISTLEDLKNYIKTSNYWADEWAIGELEIMLKVKFIIFLEDNYNNGDLLNILQCQNSSISEEIERKGNFDVKYYILLNYGSSHYKLIKYKTKSIFLFSEIPYDIKVMIADKCLERMSGIFSYIKDFIDFKTNYEMEKQYKGGKSGSGNDFDNSDGQVMEELYQFGKKKIWDDDIKLYFYSNSSDVLPGEAPGEKIPKDKIKSFSKLSKIKNWRKKLDNFWVQPFILDDKMWASVEHYYQGSKFKNDNPKFYEKFSMDSKSSLSKNPLKAKEIGENKNKRPAKVNIDKNYNNKIGNINMYTAQEAKFKQHEDLANLLLATNNANLYYHRKRKYPIQYTNLMLIRKNILYG